MNARPRTLLYAVHGDPREVLAVADDEARQPGPGEIRVEVLAAPINPADLNTIEGRYPTRPALPATPGVEGVGTVVEAGEGVRSPAPGDRVLLPHGVGTWRESCVVRADEVYPIPGDVPREQAAMLKINPATAWRMLHDFAPLQPGDWVIQNAANSGVGRAVIQIARSLGIRTVNLVRRPELAEELLAAGADRVEICDGDRLPGEIAELRPRLGFNAVGGQSALAVSNALAPGGTMVTYGAMSKQPVTIPNGLLIFKDIAFRGFWVSRWYRQAPREAQLEMIGRLAGLAREGALHAPVEATFDLADFRSAIDRAYSGGRSGKILFRMSAG
jgi:trans-2-enoyl-CoA reductase